MTFWFNKVNNGEKVYKSRSISLNFYPQHWKLIQIKDNGSKKGVIEHKVFDLNIYFLGIFIGYTNWDFN